MISDNLAEWAYLLTKTAVVTCLLIAVWALKNKDAVVVYLQF